MEHIQDLMRLAGKILGSPAPETTRRTAALPATGPIRLASGNAGAAVADGHDDHAGVWR